MSPEQAAGASNQGLYPCILVDDDPWALVDIKNTLPFSETGFYVAGEYSGAQAALAGMEQLGPALVISDICLGGMSGLELIAACRKKSFAGEFIIVSGYSDFEYARQAIQSDVSNYLLKPIDRTEGLAALQKARSRLENHAPLLRDDAGETLDRIRDYIRENYQKRLSLDDVADAFFMNRTYLSEMFRKRFGKNFVQYKNEVRIERAKVLLMNTRLSISQIAAQCGFDNTSYFAVVFRQITGCSPGQFRR